MHLPPQAYTKETLIQAYNWLRNQPVQIQELAKSPDALVSLYTKSQIHGENYLSKTNLQGFKSELKNLAHLMGDLETSNGEQKTFASQQPQQSNAQSKPQNTSIQNINTTTNTMPTSLTAAPNGSLTPALTEHSYPLTGSFIENKKSHEIHDLRSHIDSRSWGMLQEVKNHLNLSSESEALRLLISLGYQKIRPQF